MVNAPKRTLSALLAGTYCKSTKQSKWWCDQVNEVKSVLEAKWVRALVSLRSSRSTKKLAPEKNWETHFSSNEGKEQWSEDYVERETAVGRKRVEDAETAIKQKQEDMSNVEMAGLTTRKPEKTFEDMPNAIGESLRDLACSEDEVDEEDEEDDEDTAQGKLSVDDQPSGMMAMISRTVQHRMERIWPKQMNLDELTQRGWGDMADHCHRRDMKYRTTELTVPAVVKSQPDQVAAAPPPTTFGELIETPDIVPTLSQMPQVTSRPGSSHRRLGSRISQ